MARIDYAALSARVAALIEGIDDRIARMATLVCEVHHADDRFDWTGFYCVTGPEMLTVGPYQGGHGCLSIPFSRGVCGAAARSRQVQLVPDVNAVADHIACASTTRSELVLPVFDGTGALIAVFDIDSNRSDAFTAQDAEALAAILDHTFAR